MATNNIINTNTKKKNKLFLLLVIILWLLTYMTNNVCGMDNKINDENNKNNEGTNNNDKNTNNHNQINDFDFNDDSNFLESQKNIYSDIPLETGTDFETETHCTKKQNIMGIFVSGFNFICTFIDNKLFLIRTFIIPIFSSIANDLFDIYDISKKGHYGKLWWFGYIYKTFFGYFDFDFYSNQLTGICLLLPGFFFDLTHGKFNGPKKRSFMFWLTLYLKCRIRFINLNINIYFYKKNYISLNVFPIIELIVKELFFIIKEKYILRSKKTQLHQNMT